MRIKPSANALGYTSLALSLSFWILGPLSYMLHSPQMGLSFGQWSLMWAAIWLIAFALAVAAAVRGSRRWAIAAFLPLANYFFVSYVLSV